MKKTKLITLLLASLSLFANAAEAPKVQNSNALCQLFEIFCPMVTTDTSGDGAEPPKSS